MMPPKPLRVLLAVFIACPANSWSVSFKSPPRGVTPLGAAFALPSSGVVPALGLPALASSLPLSAVPAESFSLIPAVSAIQPAALAVAVIPAAARGEKPVAAAPVIAAKATASEQIDRIAESAAPALEAVTQSAAGSEDGREAGEKLEALLSGGGGAARAAGVFQALSKPQKAAFLETYLGHLRRRNGEPVIKPGDANLRFTVREKFFSEIERNPVRRTGEPVMTPDEFAAGETRRKPSAGHTPAQLWALAVAKANRSERYGVEYGLKRTPMSTYAPNDPMRWIVVEEFYHTRVLEDALNVLGLKMQRLTPHPVTALMVRSMAVLPKPLAYIAIFCGEVAGVAAFRMLLDQARVLFRDQPEALKRIEDCFRQILVDEVGHVHFVRSKLGPMRLWIARKILPLFAHFFLSDMPELSMLLGKKELRKAIVAAEVDAASAEFPEKFVPFPAR